jgi:glycosyltransferase involved in cell wall biosynthesis
MPMTVVIDGLPITGMSLGIVVEHLLEGWDQLDTGDDLHLVVGPGSDIEIPSSVTVHNVAFGRLAYMSRLRAQSLVVPRLCRKLGADVMLGVLPTTTVTPLPCPRAIIAYDVRHELRPEQFPTRARLLRKVSYDVGFRQADAIGCISERTRRDLISTHPRLARRLVEVVYLGGDHVKAWPTTDPDQGYAIAFGQYGNKNVDLVLDAWALLHQRDATTMPLVLLGLSDAARAGVETRAGQLGLSGLVTALPWLPIDEFRQRFASASLVVFPSDFEGFGLPAVEAMQLGIPVVITPEPALLEVTAGHATVMDGADADALARAVGVARRRTPDELAAARAHAEQFTWARTAERTRDLLAAAVASRRG